VHGDTIRRMIASSGKPVMVLLLTVSGSPGDRVSGLSLGADDYLAKPFHFPELVLRIRALARRQPTARSRLFRLTGILPVFPPLTPAGKELRTGFTTGDAAPGAC
jgi:DNA-binding response OmpR family regulator